MTGTPSGSAKGLIISEAGAGLGLLLAGAFALRFGFTVRLLPFAAGFRFGFAARATFRFFVPLVAFLPFVLLRAFAIAPPPHKRCICVGCDGDMACTGSSPKILIVP